MLVQDFLQTIFLQTIRNESNSLRIFGIYADVGTKIEMATFRDPVTCFAPLEVIERLIEIRGIHGFHASLLLENQEQLAQALGAFGFDGYQLGESDGVLDMDLYRSSIVPSGDSVRESARNH